MTKVNTAKELYDILHKTKPYVKVESNKEGQHIIAWQHILAFGFDTEEDLILVKEKFIKFMHDNY